MAVRDPGELLAWGKKLFDEGLLAAYAPRRQTLVRNGLMIGLLSLLGLRLRSLLALEIGSTLTRGDDAVWRIALAPEHTKNHRALDVQWPPTLAGQLDRYLAIERSEMLGGGSSNALWISRRGKPLGPEGVTHAIATLSAVRFGKDAAFRSHRFRHCIASAVPFVMPEAPNVAASVLNIGAGTVSENYVRGGAIKAAHTYHEIIERLRNEPPELA